MNDDYLKHHLRKLALKKLCPNGYSARGDEVIPISDPTPTQAEIDAEVEKQNAEYDAQEYARKRAEAYPTWQEQMDLIYHSGVAGLKAELKKTKDKFPKE